MTNEELNYIGNRIKSLRKEQNMSQEVVAKQLEISRQAVTRWENGRTLPSSGHILKLAELFGVTVESLTGKNGPLGVEEVKPIPNWEELKADIKAEIRRYIWVVWTLLLTIMFFTSCWFFNEHLGWRVYVWHYLELYYYPWTVYLLIFIGGVLQKKRFVASICIGCVMTVLLGQLIALYTRSHSPLRLNESWIALIIFWNVALVIGLFLEYRIKKKPWKTKTKVMMCCVVLIFACVSFGGFRNNYTYNRGAEDGYLAGYEAGFKDASSCVNTREEQEEEDAAMYREEWKVATTIWGMSRYKGFFVHWGNGYEAGYKAGDKAQ